MRNPDCKDESVCTIELDDNTVQKLSKDSFNNVVLTGLKACGYIDKQEIERMFVNSCDFKQLKTSKNLNRERTDDRREILKSIISGGFLIFLQFFTLFWQYGFR